MHSWLCTCSFASRTARLGIALSLLFSATLTVAQEWTSSDIGGARPGGSMDRGGRIELFASGADIWGQADAFHFYSKPWTGDGEFIARVSYYSPGHEWAKMGLMFRESLVSDSRHAMICATRANGTAFTFRNAAAAETSMTGVTWWTEIPVWLKLVRSGNVFTGYTSFDGREWAQAGTTTWANAPETLHAGFALTSHSSTYISANVDNFSITVPRTAPGAPVLTARADQIVNTGSLYTYQILASNSPTLFAATGLPAGLSLNAQTGEIRGVCGGNAGAYTATLSATNAEGTGRIVQTFTVTGTGPIEMPFIESVTLPAAGTYRVGETLLFQVQYHTGYSFPYVTGRPRIALKIGDNLRYADYAWGSGSEMQGFAYRVQEGDVGATSVSTADTIDLNGGSIRDSYGLWCALNTRTVATTNIRFAPAAAPTGIPVLTTPDTAPAAYGQDFSFQITATQAPTTFWASPMDGPSHFTGLQMDELTGTITGRIQLSGKYTFQLAAANAMGAGTKTLVIAVPHIITRLAGPSPGTYAQGNVLTFTVYFSSPVRIEGAASLGFSIGQQPKRALATPGVGQVHSFKYTVQPGDTDTDGVLSLAPALSTMDGSIVDAESGDPVRLQIPLGSEPTGVIVAAPGHEPPVIISSSSIAAMAGQPFIYNTVATNSPTFYNAYPLPQGVTIDPNGGQIRGTVATPGTYEITIAASNSGGTGYQRLTLYVAGDGSSWQSQDVGAVGAAGSSSDAAGMLTVSGSGADIWGTTDAFRFTYVMMQGDGELVARVTAFDATHPWAKAGLMARVTLAHNSAYKWVGISGANGSFVQDRPMLGGETSMTTPTWNTVFPTWLRLVRTGKQVDAYVSSSGAEPWTHLSVTSWYELPQTIYMGIAVSSHSYGQLSTATFDNVRFWPAAPAETAPAAPSNIQVSAPSPGQVIVTWTDNATNESQFQIERSTGGGAFVLIGTSPADSARFDDTTVTSNTRYRYRVLASNAARISAAITSAEVTTPAGSVWSFGDVGNVGIAGSNSSGTNSITITGSGADIWDTQDAFRFVYRTVQGNFTAEAFVGAPSPTHPWARAGVMIRESLAPTARNVFGFVTPDTLIAAQIRRTTHTEMNGAYWSALPHWVRLVRLGNRITVYASPDALSWKEVAAYDLSLPESVLVGFAVTAHDTSQSCTAVFTDPSIR